MGIGIRGSKSPGIPDLDPPSVPSAPRDGTSRRALQELRSHPVGSKALPCAEEILCCCLQLAEAAPVPWSTGMHQEGAVASRLRRDRPRQSSAWYKANYRLFLESLGQPPPFRRDVHSIYSRSARSRCHVTGTECHTALPWHRQPCHLPSAGAAAVAALPQGQSRAKWRRAGRHQRGQCSVRAQR